MDLEADWKEMERLRQLPTTERAKQQQQGLAQRPGLSGRPGVQRAAGRRGLGVEGLDQLLNPELKRALEAQKAAEVCGWGGGG